MSEDDFEYTSSHQDALENFFTSPTKDNFPSLLQADKEYDALDFKTKWHDMGKLAKHILAFSNSGGGVVVYGVKELNDGSLESTGLEEVKDEAQFGSQIETYIPDSAHTLYALEKYKYDDVYDDEIAGKTFQVVFIDGAGEQVPLVSTSGGNAIRDGTIYIRRSTKSVPANYEEVQSLLKQRLESSLEKTTAELHEELQELKTLYDEIDKNKKYMPGMGSMLSAIQSMPVESKPNPNFPDEDYEEYIAGLIVKKKIAIERRIGVSGIEL